MEVEARMTGEPGFDPWMLVRGVVAGDQMQFECAWNSVVEMVEEGQELLMPMARVALRNDLSVKY